MSMTKRPYTAGHFELMIDGCRSSAYLKSVEGGATSTSVVDEPVGPDNKRIKHMSTVDIDPITLDIGISNTKDILKWIRASWKKDPTGSYKNGQITHANFDLKGCYCHEFYDALITETTFPALDGSSKDAAYMKVKIQPQRVVENKLPGSEPVQAPTNAAQKMWTPSSFRLTIDGVDGLEYSNKIDSFTIKQSVKKQYCGEERFPKIFPTKIEFPNITGTVSLEFADALLKWKKDYVDAGQSCTKAQKTGMLEFLAPDKKTCLFFINLYEIGIKKVEIPGSKANEDTIKRVKYDFYIGAMELDGAFKYQT